MDATRWLKIVPAWDIETGTEAWVSEVKMILTQAQCLVDQYLNDQTGLEFLKGKLLGANRISWKLDASTKTKMDLFQNIHNFNKSRTLLNSNLNRRRRSLVTKLKAGVFLIHIETGRYKGTKKRGEILCSV